MEALTELPLESPGSTATYNTFTGANVGGGGAFGPVASPISPQTGGASTRHVHPVTLTTSTSGSGVSQNMPPAAIGGITLIRAG